MIDIKSAMAAYNNIAGITQNAPLADATPKTSSTDPSFSDLISQSLSDAVDSGHSAEKISTLAMLGKADITQLAISVGSAEQALETVVAIRDKVISAYQQISQMPM